MPMQLSNIQEQLGNKESYLYEYLFKIKGEKKHRIFINGKTKSME